MPEGIAFLSIREGLFRAESNEQTHCARYASGEGGVPISFGSSYLIGLAITGAPIPWQQLVEPLRGILGDAGEHVGEPGQRIDVIELCRHDQCSHDGRAIGAAL